MAYRNEKERNGRNAIVIDGWEKGIADSPYGGISSLKNLNVSFLTGSTYVNYKRLPVTLTGSMGIPKFYTQSPGNTPTYYMVDDKGQVWVGTNGGATWTLLTGNHTGTNLGYGIAYFKDYLFVFGNNYLDVCGNGTGPGGITSGNWVSLAGSGYFFQNLTAVSITTGVTSGDTSLTLSSSWQYASGTYQITLASGQNVNGSFTHGSATVPFSPAANATNVTATINIQLFTNTSPPNHMALVAINDFLYFCNGNTIGSISAPVGQVFNPQSFNTMTINYAALTLRTIDRSIWLAELNANLVIAVQDHIYQWDKLGTSFTATPINESPSRMINILNNIYIFAGQKGDIYISNGYSVSLFKKIPDSFLGVIDPIWVIGGMMFHRNKLYFGGLGYDSALTTKIQGIFSVTISTGLQSSSDTTGAINFESQNSYGSVPTGSSNADATGMLIDLNYLPASGLGAGGSVDMFVSAYYNNSVGGIDINDTTLWQNYEPQIETDLIPVGTFLESKTFENIEYKLDEPLKQGDSIQLSYRTNFNSSYTLVGTSAVTGDVANPGTTTATSSVLTQVLSDNFNSNIENAQWVQFKVAFKCASSGSSFIRLREIRLHYNL